MWRKGTFFFNKKNYFFIYEVHMNLIVHVTNTRISQDSLDISKIFLSQIFIYRFQIKYTTLLTHYQCKLIFCDFLI